MKLSNDRNEMVKSSSLDNELIQNIVKLINRNKPNLQTSLLLNTYSNNLKSQFKHGKKTQSNIHFTVLKAMEKHKNVAFPKKVERVHINPVVELDKGVIQKWQDKKLRSLKKKFSIRKTRINKHDSNAKRASSKVQERNSHKKLKSSKLRKGLPKLIKIIHNSIVLEDQNVPMNNKELLAINEDSQLFDQTPLILKKPEKSCPDTTILKQPNIDEIQNKNQDSLPSQSLESSNQISAIKEKCETSVILERLVLDCSKSNDTSSKKPNIDENKTTEDKELEKSLPPPNQEPFLLTQSFTKKKPETFVDVGIKADSSTNGKKLNNEHINKTPPKGKELDAPSSNSKRKLFNLSKSNDISSKKLNIDENETTKEKQLEKCLPPPTHESSFVIPSSTEKKLETSFHSEVQLDLNTKRKELNNEHTKNITWDGKELEDFFVLKRTLLVHSKSNDILLDKVNIDENETTNDRQFEEAPSPSTQELSLLKQSSTKKKTETSVDSEIKLDFGTNRKELNNEHIKIISRKRKELKAPTADLKRKLIDLITVEEQPENELDMEENQIESEQLDVRPSSQNEKCEEQNLILELNDLVTDCLNQSKEFETLFDSVETSSTQLLSSYEPSKEYATIRRQPTRKGKVTQGRWGKEAFKREKNTRGPDRELASPISNFSGDFSSEPMFENSEEFPNSVEINQEQIDLSNQSSVATLEQNVDTENESKKKTSCESNTSTATKEKNCSKIDNRYDYYVDSDTSLLVPSDSILQPHKTYQVFICPVCNNLFTRKKRLDKHMKTHFICKLCKTKVKTLDALKDHLEKYCIELKSKYVLKDQNKPTDVIEEDN